jgi:hypothetical protein
MGHLLVNQPDAALQIAVFDFLAKHGFVSNAVQVRR